MDINKNHIKFTADDNDSGLRKTELMLDVAFQRNEETERYDKVTIQVIMSEMIDSVENRFAGIVLDEAEIDRLMRFCKRALRKASR